MRAALLLAATAATLSSVSSDTTGCGPSDYLGAAIISAPDVVAAPTNSNRRNSGGSTGTQCTWNLAAATNASVVIYFVDFQLNDDHDSLRVYAGSQLVTSYGGGASAPPTLNLGAKARLVFSSDNVMTNRSLKILFVSRERACGGFYTADSKRANDFVITSPGYPNVYPALADCTWTVVFSGGRTRLQFTSLDLEPGSHDKLSVYDGANVVKRYRNSSKEFSPFSLGKTVTITFTGKPAIDMRGFRAVFRSGGASSAAGGTGPSN